MYVNERYDRIIVRIAYVSPIYPVNYCITAPIQYSTVVDCCQLLKKRESEQLSLFMCGNPLSCTPNFP